MFFACTTQPNELKGYEVNQAQHIQDMFWLTHQQILKLPQNILLSFRNFFMKRGVWLIAESFDQFFFSHMSKPKEMSPKFRNRLLAKFPVTRHNKQETQIKTVGQWTFIELVAPKGGVLCRAFNWQYSLLAICNTLAFALGLELVVPVIFDVLSIFSVELIVLCPVQSIWNATGLERLHNHFCSDFLPGFIHPSKHKVSCRCLFLQKT